MGGSSRDTSSYAEFAQELRKYVPNKKIIHLISKLPPAGSVYGYDMGDLTADSLPDIVVSLRRPTGKFNDVYIYFFLTQGEYFNLVKILKRTFNEDPLEVAFYIEDGTCFITDKIQEQQWRVDGYTVGQMVFRQVYSWENKLLPGGKIGVQVEHNLRTMRTVETYYNTESMHTVSKLQYYTVPAYPVDKRLSGDIPSIVGDTSSRAVLHGASNWIGPDDCALTVYARYDTSNVTVYAIVRDETVVGGDSESVSDRLDFWLQTTGASIFEYEQGKYEFAQDAGAGLLGISISAVPGGVFKRLSLRIAGMKKAGGALEQIHSTTARMNDGGILFRATIPLSLLPSSTKGEDVRFVAAYRDIDNPDKPMWNSVVATSDTFEPGIPYTFGRMMFINPDETPFERDDLRMQPLLRQLSNAGVIPR